ncbi:GGDEF domain-containing protein [Roseateles sp. DAIF2]|uniref:GGDEF domain-containing protein n=1 Tax=Roseateles sp. DAIF2 TaxID=2714952 RepID=UPI0018A2AE76|nr:GGDEF domain-containing protein [Roseateles sp. DAIF2]QPF74779.1 GGDEF domain-containing protein [Roseateles sp. DAIF2]
MTAEQEQQRTDADPPAVRDEDIEQVLERGRKDLSAARYRPAYDLFMQASQRAHDSGALASEARALALLAYAAATLGHSEEAIETAMLATQLARACPNDDTLQIKVGNYLGIALLWNGSHEGADAVLAQTYEQAKREPRSDLFWHPQINRGLNEAYKLFALRHMARQVPQPRRLQTMLDALEAHAAVRPAAGAQPAPLMASGLGAWLRSLAAAWAGQPEQARRHEQELQEVCKRHAQVPMLTAMAHWLRAELALASGRQEEALLAARKLAALTLEINHQPLQRVALLLQADLHEMNGRADAALDCLRQQQLREHQLRQVSMHHRRNVAALRFELRQHKQEVRSLKHSTEQLQRLSMEDALTAPLANRRGLERRLGQALAQPAREPLFVAVVDVDQFKSVNDRHSHQVGDQVLKTLAGLFQQLLRSEDIAGRWGGDEFVLAFRAVDAVQAEGVVERLRRAVRLHPWETLAPGLCVSISLGLTQAQDGDDLDALLLRSDLGMYAHKRQRR